MSHVDSELAGLLRTIDLPTLGTRVRNARLAKGLTQSEVAGEDASTAYISRIESGHRRPDGRLLEKIAARIDTTLEQLLHGIDANQKAELTLKLDYAELALASGKPDDALAGTLEVLEHDAPPELRTRARHLRALALESAGDLDHAIGALEELVAAPAGGLDWLVSAIALSRCYRESGDLARAIDTGENAMSRLEEYDLAGSDEAVQLAVTLAAAHFERGDVAHAVRLCHRAIEQAEGLDSPRAKASAYWNASVMESNQGRVEAAVSLAQKAIRLLELDTDNRNLARLRTQLGWTQLRLDPPALEDAEANLARGRAGAGLVEREPDRRRTPPAGAGAGPVPGRRSGGGGPARRRGHRRHPDRPAAARHRGDRHPRADRRRPGRHRPRQELLPSGHPHPVGGRRRPPGGPALVRARRPARGDRRRRRGHGRLPTGGRLDRPDRTPQHPHPGLILPGRGGDGCTRHRSPARQGQGQGQQHHPSPGPATVLTAPACAPTSRAATVVTVTAMSLIERDMRGLPSSGSCGQEPLDLRE